MRGTRKYIPGRVVAITQFLCAHRCNKHLLGLGQHVKKSLIDAGIIGYQFGTVGVRCAFPFTIAYCYAPLTSLCTWYTAMESVWEQKLCPTRFNLAT